MRRRAVAAVLVLSLTAWGPCDARVANASFRRDETPAVVQVRPMASSWRSVARSAGWPASAWPRLSCIIKRESGGKPGAVGDHGTSIGLLQIHLPVWRTFLAKRGITVAMLKSGYWNLRAGWLIFKAMRAWTGNGWAPWRGGGHRC